MYLKILSEKEGCVSNDQRVEEAKHNQRRGHLPDPAKGNGLKCGHTVHLIMGTKLVGRVIIKTQYR